MDIVEYSKKSVSGQISLKERFNAFLSTAIRDVPNNDRIILDTGDGAAISFLGDVEDALRAALSMRHSLLSEEGLIDPPLLVRMGINLGPVRLVKDINGQPNIVGDGINVAQRVMGFAEPGQILVSRSYYDAASRLSQEYAGMFHFEGSRTDKHVREHEVYAIGYPGDLTAAQKSADSKAKTKAKISKILLDFRVMSEKLRDTAVIRYHDFAVHIRETFHQATRQQQALYLGLAAVPLLLLLLLVIKLALKPEVPDNNLAVAANVTSTLPADAAPSAGVPAAPAPVAKATVHESKTAKLPPKEKKPQKSGSTGTVSLMVKPWGEIYLDGKWVDVSPPLTKLQVPKGSHVIEIRNTTFPVYKRPINIKAGETILIRHKFAN